MTFPPRKFGGYTNPQLTFKSKSKVVELREGRQRPPTLNATASRGFEWIGSGSISPNKRAALGSFQGQSNSLKQRRFLCPSTGTANTYVRKRPVL